MESYTAIVVGGGPSGLECARELSKLGHKVLVLERSKIPGEPNFSTGGTPLETINEYNIPLSVTKDYFNKISLITNIEKAVFTNDFPAGYVLDFREFKKHLADEIRKGHGWTVYGSDITNVKFERGKIKSLSFVVDGHQKEVSAKYFIDATAKEGALVSKLGLRNHKNHKTTTGIEYIVKVKLDDFYKNNLCIFLGGKYLPDGYAWVFPFGTDTYKIGVIVYDGKESDFQKPEGGYLDSFLQSISKNGFEILEKHGGTLILTNGFKRNVWGNIISVGDNAGMCNPLFAEGIRHALFSGRLAARIIDKTERGNLEINHLLNYDAQLNKYKGSSWGIGRFFADLLYHTKNDKLKDLLTKRVSKLSCNDVIDTGFEYNFSSLLKLLK
ncbi:hypothetical protein A2716_04895 [candidate division WWE3 bacterium RIFCSPHIGHO2_01_FULL_40_23]|uniref:Digeranylgeranylglycerophospholipid reductase catalytic domain-containing protein n=1 Tax=candidate division WWE3 bacterium RIFCSPLOWO2_01_FULL_41_18 TaxID=1802625 RepID=A0A1F4VDH2_UNCKA|nr:MAG: hypothetical protein A2716_04895 [candidate division WWE3 bacterium RIFCSPHIGHO2_01_FULL_40_23]OGC55207.1 MAG: hypothetical protein A3A78_04505 [candidate division WWE3 bacterium RIFCSPLOWO2_01_FULL_41_18]